MDGDATTHGEAAGARVLAYAVLAVLLAVLAVPVLARPPIDSFPASNYPMFAGERPAVAWLPEVVLVGADGSVQRQPPEVVGGSDQVIHAAETVRRAIERRSVGALCGEIASRLVGRVSTGSTVEVAMVRVDVVAWFDGQREPLDRVVHCRREVTGG